MTEQDSLFSRLFQNSRGAEAVCFAGSDPVNLSSKGVKVPTEMAGYYLGWDDTRLEVRVDVPLGRSDAPQARDVIIFDPASFYRGVGHFIRLSRGQKLVLDTHDDEFRNMFPTTSPSARRKIEIHHEGEDLVFRQTAPEVKTYVQLQAPDESEISFESHRIEALQLVAKTYGGPLEIRSAEFAASQLDQLQSLLEREPRRPNDADGDPGAVVELPRKKTAVLVGDLHGCVDNLLTVLSWNGVMQSLERNDAILVLLGDTVHPDSGSDLGDMRESVLMLDLIFSLKLRFPRNVYYLLGNHDSFSPEVTKAGVAQGVLWSKQIVELRGSKYRDRLAQVYDSLPLIACSPFFCACHAGPPPGKVCMETLRNARKSPHLVHELTWTRQQMPGRPHGYTKKHSRRFRKALGLHKNAPFIVGHYPRGEEGGIWQNVGGVNGHHVVYSSRSEAIGVFIQNGETMLPQTLRGEQLTRWLNQRIHDGVS